MRHLERPVQADNVQIHVDEFLFQVRQGRVHQRLRFVDENLGELLASASGYLAAPGAVSGLPSRTASIPPWPAQVGCWLGTAARRENLAGFLIVETSHAR
jgi:hypothetical protein